MPLPAIKLSPASLSLPIIGSPPRKVSPDNLPVKIGKLSVNCKLPVNCLPGEVFSGERSYNGTPAGLPSKHATHDDTNVTNQG